MRKKSLVLYCFSPPVMLATFIIEICLAGYSLVKYKMSALIRVAVSMLALLALFQLSEYFVCGLSSDYVTWSKIGYLAITFLPPLGFHLLHLISGKTNRRAVVLAYLSGLALALYFVLNSTAFSSHECTGNYVIFRIGRMAVLYGIYYYGWLFSSLILAAQWAHKLRAKRSALYGLIIGYLIFLVPTAVVNTLKPETVAGIPSIMCGFAVLFALILVGRILPNTQNKRQR